MQIRQENLIVVSLLEFKEKKASFFMFAFCLSIAMW